MNDRPIWYATVDADPGDFNPKEYYTNSTRFLVQNHKSDWFQPVIEVDLLGTVGPTHQCHCNLSTVQIVYRQLGTIKSAESR